MLNGEVNMITYRNNVSAEFSDKFQVLMLQIINFDINTLKRKAADEKDEKIDLVGEENYVE